MREQVSTVATRRLAELWLLLVLAGWPGLSQSQTASGLEVRPADREQLVQEPRQVVVVTFLVRNTSGRGVEVDPRIGLPAGWRLITSELPYQLADGQAAVRLISFLIPDGAPAGEYRVTYEARDRLIAGIADSYSVRVEVGAMPRLRALALEAPDFAIEGESYDSVFLVRNVGNAAIKANFKVQGVEGSAPSPRQGALQLAPGEASRLIISVTAPRVRRRTPALLMLTVTMTGERAGEVVTSTTEVVPRLSSEDAYRTLAAQLDMRLVMHQQGSYHSTGWQPDLSGAGALDEENSRFLSFRLRGPDARNSGSLAFSDEYWVRYRDNTLTGLLGDGTFGMSMLTEPGRYGRGAHLAYDGADWGLSGYGMQDRFGLTSRQAGLALHYQPTSDTRLDVNFLDKSGGTLPGMVESVRSQTRWTAGLNTDLEVGHSGYGGMDGEAIRGALYDNSHAVHYYALGWRADADFRGYLHDKEYLSTGFDYPRTDGWDLHGYYRLQDWNVLPQNPLAVQPQDPNALELLQNAPTEQQINLGTGKSLATGTRLTFDFDFRKRTNGTSGSGEDVMSRFGRVSVGQAVRDLSFLYSLQLGSTHNRISGAQFGSVLQILSAIWMPASGQTYGIHAVRDENADSDDPQRPQTTLGANATYQVGSALYCSLDAQRVRSRFGSGAIYNATLFHNFLSGARIALTGRLINGPFAQSDVLVTYSIPFAMPVARRQDVAAVRGRLYDAETGTGLPNVLLILDGLSAVTNGRGEFEFPAVKAGQYRLSMSRSSVSVSKVPLIRLPIELTVVPHEPQDVQIAFANSVTIVVNVRRQDDAAGSGASSALPSPVAVPNALITLQSESETYRRVTDGEGGMRLGGLPPGKWSVTLAEDAIPEGYTVNSRVLSLEVAPGAVGAAEFTLIPVAREMKMLPKLKVSAVKLR
jgi:hypothetical protein